MKYYRRPTPIKAISFDLDDTLYANSPIMIGAEEKMLTFFAELFNDIPVTNKLASKHNFVFDQQFWLPFKQQAIAKQPLIFHDVVAFRLESYYLGACALGYSSQQAKIKAQQGMDYFAVVRSQFTVPQASHELLKKLAQHFPLVAITNGNVDTKAIDLEGYFQDVFYAVGGLKQKPSADMFHLACKRLTIKPQELLHVGDCGNADILGAIAAGCQAAWLPIYHVGKPLKVLPHIELSSVNELTDLLPD